MEWIEVTGKTTEEAEEHALKMLGIDREDVEFMVLEEPKSSLLGFKKTSARLRARVKPRRAPDKRRQKKVKRPVASQGSQGKTKPQKRQRNRAEMKPNETSAGKNSNASNNRPLMDQKIQEEILEEFLQGLLNAWKLSAEISFEWPREDICEVSIKGQEELETLIGHNAEVLQAIEKIARIALKKKTEDTRYAQIRLDINEFRLKRQQALEDFVRKLADEVVELGTPKILEPMGNRDRKIVHDTLSEVSGVATVSEGENPKRRVKIIPEN